MWINLFVGVQNGEAHAQLITTGCKKDLFVYKVVVFPEIFTQLYYYCKGVYLQEFALFLCLLVKITYKTCNSTKLLL